MAIKNWEVEVEHNMDASDVKKYRVKANTQKSAERIACMRASRKRMTENVRAVNCLRLEEVPDNA